MIPIQVWPLARSKGRAPQITSGHAARNPDRPAHRGVDLFYRYDRALDGDVPVGDGAGSADPRTGEAKWWIPDNTPAIAVAPGIVVSARESNTGYLVWLDIGGGYMAGYFHLRNLFVKRGQRVVVGQPLGIVDHNPSPAADARHLHFELYRGTVNADGSAVIGYPGGTIDPQSYLTPSLPAMDAPAGGGHADVFGRPYVKIGLATVAGGLLFLGWARFMRGRDVVDPNPAPRLP